MQERSPAGGRTEESARETMNRAQEVADGARQRAAEAMEQAGDRVREQGQSTAAVSAQASAKVANSLEKTAGYLRDHDSAGMLNDVEEYVRGHPVQAVAGAVIGGFVIGRIIH